MYGFADTGIQSKRELQLLLPLPVFLLSSFAEGGESAVSVACFLFVIP